LLHIIFDNESAQVSCNDVSRVIDLHQNQDFVKRGTKM